MDFTDGPWIGGIVQEDFNTETVIVQMGRRRGDVVDLVTGFGNSIHGVELLAIPEDQVVDISKAVRIPTGLARLLLEALARHFGGTGDTRTLRRDYDAERERVDKFIDHIISRG